MQPTCKLAHFRCRRALTAIHAHRQADDERANFPNLGKLGDPPDGVALGLVNCFDRMGEDAEVVGRGDANSRIAMIDAECGMRGI